MSRYYHSGCDVGFRTEEEMDDHLLTCGKRWIESCTDHVMLKHDYRQEDWKLDYNLKLQTRGCRHCGLLQLRKGMPG